MSELVLPVPATRSLEGVLRDALSTTGELRLVVGTSVDGGQLSDLDATRYGHVSIAGSPPIRVAQLSGAIPYGEPYSGAGWHTFPGLPIYLLVYGLGQIVAIGYINTEGAG